MNEDGFVIKAGRFYLVNGIIEYLEEEKIN